MRLAWRGFKAWVLANTPEDEVTLTETMTQMEALHSNLTQDSIKDTINLSCVTRIFQLFDTYLDTLRHGCDLSAFWMSYIDMIEIVLGLLRASREGNWLLHLAIVREMIPWCFAYDNQNYAKYMPVYFGQMSRLETDHPDVYQHCMNGGFSTQMSE